MEQEPEWRTQCVAASTACATAAQRSLEAAAGLAASQSASQAVNCMRELPWASERASKRTGAAMEFWRQQQQRASCALCGWLVALADRRSRRRRRSVAL